MASQPTDDFDTEWFLTNARQYLGDRSNEELCHLALDVLHAVSTRAKEEGRALMVVARDDGRPETTGDDEVDAVYCRITNKKVALTVQAVTVKTVPSEINVDYDADGEIVGVEILGVPNPPGGGWIVTRRGAC